MRATLRGHLLEEGNAFTLCPAGHAGSNLRRTREYARRLCVCVKSERDREAHTREEEGPGENARDAAAEERRGRARRRWCRAAFRLRSRRGKAAPRGVGKAPADAGPRGRTDGPSAESPGPGRTRLLRTPRVAAAVGKDAPESGRKPWTASGRRARRPPTVRRRVACRKRRLPEASPAGSVTFRKWPRGGLGGRDRDRGIKQGNDLRGWTCQPTLPWKSFLNIHTRASNRQVVPRKFAQCYLSVTSQ